MSEVNKIKDSKFRLFLQEYKELCRLGLPVLVTQVGIIVVSFIDTMMVGAYGIDELAASAFVNSVFMIPGVMQIGFAGGITPIVGALYGMSKHKKIGETLRGALQINTILSISFTLIMGVLYFFLDKFGQPDELMPLIRNYYLLILCSLLPMAIFNCCQQVSNGITDTATPMWIILGANVINIVGNYLLIFGKFGFPELGLEGAGIATLTARLFSSTAMLMIFAFTKKRRIYRDSFFNSRGFGNTRRQIWSTSYPVMIQSGLEVCLWTLGAVVCGWFGKVQLASYQVVNTISQLGFMIFMSVGVAISIRVANFTGTRQWDKLLTTSRAGLHLNLLLGLLASLTFVFFGHEMIGWFTPEESVINAAMLLIPPLILYQFGDAVQLTYANALRGTSKVRPLLIVALVSYIIIGAPLLLILSVNLEMHNIGVYYSFSGALVSAAILLYIFFRQTLHKLRNE